MHLAFPYSQGFGISGVSISALKLLKWSKEVRQVGERAQKMSITANFCQREMLLDDLKLKIISMNSPVSRLVRSETVSDIQRQDISESRIDLRKPLFLAESEFKHDHLYKPGPENFFLKSFLRYHS